MIEVRWHGRGGQGAFTAARLLGHVASIYEGKYAQAFPSFGPERRGAPVMSFTRISDDIIYDHSEVEECDYVIVLDDTLYNLSIIKGLKENGTLLINTSKNAADFNDVKSKVITINATDMALKILKRPITNVPMLGALAAEMNIGNLDSLYSAIDDQLSPKIREKNKELLTEAYNYVKGGQ